MKRTSKRRRVAHVGNPADQKRVTAFIRRLDADRPGQVRWNTLARNGDQPDVSVGEVATHCAWFIDACAAELTSVVGDRVALSVKFLWMLPSEEQPVLRTLLRSSGTRLQREESAPRNNIAYWENSAFKTLLHEWPNCSHYSADGLRDLWVNGKYENTNRGWMEFYDSTSVVAIPQSKKGSTLPVGFLCADSLLGKLAEKDIAEFLGEAARHIYDILSVLVRVEGKHARISARAMGASPISLPFGWRYVDDRLIADEPSEQYKFQTILEDLEAFYRSERSAPVRDSGGGALLNEEKNMPSHGEYFPEFDDPIYEELSPPVTELPKLSSEELDKVLERMAPFNPDAAKELRKRRGV